AHSRRPVIENRECSPNIRRNGHHARMNKTLGLEIWNLEFGIWAVEPWDLGNFHSVIRHSRLAGSETTPKISAKVWKPRVFLESFSRVSRVNLERYSSDTRAILETYPTRLRSISGLVSRGIRVYSRAREGKSL